MKSRILTLSIIICCLLFTNCKNGEVNNKYCNLPARLHIENVLQAPTVLLPACESMGEYCTITLSSDGQRFVFTNAAGKTDLINILAISSYNGYYLGLCGFIVGLLEIPEQGEDYVHVVCYDLACSNCYKEKSITKPLLLQTGGYAKCQSCGRTYSLNEQGNVTAAGPAGRPLYRYRVNYINRTLYINNG